MVVIMEMPTPVAVVAPAVAVRAVGKVADKVTRMHLQAVNQMPIA